ncbi:hypothetical protein [Propionicimonas sp.]|uniref:DUF6891 domain-containing protein n=1 Tax=Propionicimonas sp. TaxID=1955623 RepID=UPI001827DB36|nr:hypothetical protein [Propionicimonas sp.]MBU3976960.1 hypothetical protein [Actinomycetota bacterium]MBA3020531.1 hypothetical protein [Propionicimonas sp.]MBU3986705.1 hypothetical protein [Actinomycetota bacterium]MBU4007143.1 hypothetical protein [Actinomycetota bacterium]MBU4064896.1 hypothetical protein [Actinomycetota bacterium]
MIAPSPYYVQPEGLRLSDDLGLSEKQERKLRDFTWNRVILGTTEADEFLEWAVEGFPKRKKKVLKAAFDQVLQARRDQQASWPAEVRTTALDRAFAELRELGILAKPNFSCCGNCANHEIWDERDDSRTWRGYVYFHAQDAERIPEDRETYLGYGVFLDGHLPEAEWEALSDEEKDQTYTQLVREVMGEATEVIERHGIEVAWDQDLGVRILLRNVDWYAAV